ncbi:hypothetical protein [Halegenticoccus tardaugens]|uniref:hypothetical protein n=1 Tax=Halegenticoccus tardaugens TaxID=2071624 RepID=UPI00100BADD7|nr:hypothetical protein [Halegenticoccus tardaugens]
MDANGLTDGASTAKRSPEETFRRAKRGLLVHPPLAVALWLLVGGATDLPPGRVRSFLVSAVLVFALFQSFVAGAVVVDFVNASRYHPTYRTFFGVVGLLLGLLLLTAGFYGTFYPDVTDDWREGANERAEQTRVAVATAETAEEVNERFDVLLEAEGYASAMTVIAAVGPVLVGALGAVLAAFGYLGVKTGPPREHLT